MVVQLKPTDNSTESKGIIFWSLSLPDELDGAMNDCVLYQILKKVKK